MTRRRWAAALLVAVVCGLVVDLLRPLPAAWFAPAESRRVVDRHGVLLGERALPERGRQYWVERAEVAPAVIDALIASEDHRFGHHPGLDPIGLGRALVADVRAGAIVQGGSTLHQQTARLLAGRPPGLVGKAVEGWRAVRLWAHRSDDEVLTWYLNRAYFGRGSFGIAAAARRTFDEDPARLSLAEAATLVGLLPAPSRLHPEVDPAAARAARDTVLDKMVRYRGLAPEAAARAKEEPIQLRRPHVEGDAVQLVERLLEADPDAPVVRTTVDAGLQRDVQERVSEQLAALTDREVSQAAVLVVHLPTREVRAYVASADRGTADGQVDGLVALRSPGSALKPLLYGMAFDGGLAPSDVLADVETRWDTTHGSWLPENYTRTYEGPVTARQALGSSLNVPAVKVLERVGVASFQARLDAVGFGVRRTATSLGLGLSLGDVEVSVEQLARAYAALATDGRVRALRLRPQDPPTDAGVPLVSPTSAALVTDVLADPTARAVGFGRYGVLERPYPAAVKTGTSTGFRDNWAVGYTPEWLVAVWVGNFDGTPMRDVSGVTGAGPLWASVLDRVSGGREVAFAAPDGMERREMCALSGGAPGPGCPRASDWFPAAAPARPTCTWHVPGCAGVAWPPELSAWAHDHGRSACGARGDAAPAAIAWPEDGAVVYVDPRLPRGQQRLPLRAAGAPGTAFRWRIDGVDVGESQGGAPFPWEPPGPGRYALELLSDGAVVERRSVEVRGGDAPW